MGSGLYTNSATNASSELLTSIHGKILIGRWRHNHAAFAACMHGRTSTLHDNELRQSVQASYQLCECFWSSAEEIIGAGQARIFLTNVR
jgi:hypothetical protein